MDWQKLKFDQSVKEMDKVKPIIINFLDKQAYKMEDLINKWAELTFNEVNQERKINLLSNF